MSLATDLGAGRALPALPGPSPAGRGRWVRTLWSSPITVISAAFLAVAVLAALFAPVLTPHDPTYLDPAVRLQGPSPDHLLGTDDRGRDVFSRVIYGGRVSLTIGVSVTVAAAIIGSLLGLLSGYFPPLDTPVMRTLDGLMAFPSILLAIAIMASLGASAVNVFIALVVVYTPVVARLVRSTTLVTKQQPYVESARAIGMTDRADSAALRLSQRALAADRAVHLCRRLRHHLRGLALLPGRRRRSRDPHLGQYAA